MENKVADFRIDYLLFIVPNGIMLLLAIPNYCRRINTPNYYSQLLSTNSLVLATTKYELIMCSNNTD